MSSLLARSIGLVQDRPIATDVAIILLERRSPLTRTESRLVVFDYLGLTREQLATELGVSITTLKSYWKRINKKMNTPSRAALRCWVETTLQADLAGEPPADAA